MPSLSRDDPHRYFTLNTIVTSLIQFAAVVLPEQLQKASCALVTVGKVGHASLAALHRADPLNGSA
jgi:hypothetical protein